MLGVNGKDEMLHSSEFEYFNTPFFPDFNLEEYYNIGIPLDDWESSPSEDPSNALLSYENENLHDDIYSLVDPDHFYKPDSDEAVVMTGEYHVLNEHAYSSVFTFDPSPLVDIWNSSDDMHRTVPPVNPNPCRRNMRRRKASKVSINTAAKAALKRAAWTRPSHKRRKIENSVETTPSSSDYEDARSRNSRNRNAKCTAIKAINRFNSNTKAVKSEVQRTNHNRNEKKRREHMSYMMKKVRFLVPAEFYRERTEKARAKASKQKILVACESYIHHLNKTEDAKLEEERKAVVMKHRRLLKQFKQLKCKIEALARLKNS